MRAGERRLHEPLRDEVGIAAVRRGRVRVVLHGQSEVPASLVARRLERRTRPRPSASRSRARDRESASDPPSAGAPGTLPAPSRRARPAAARRAPRRSSRCGPSAPASGPRGGCSGSPLRPRKRAVTPFAAIMKSSISIRARLFAPPELDDVAVVAITGSPRSSRGRARPARGAGSRIRSATSSCRRSCAARPRLRAIASGLGPSTVQPCRDTVVRELGVVVDEGAWTLRRGAVPSCDRISIDDRQPVLVLVQRREIGGESLRQHREHARGGVDRGRVVARVRVDGRVLLHQRVDVGDCDEHAHAAVLPRSRPTSAGRDRASRRCRSSTTEVSHIDSAPFRAAAARCLGLLLCRGWKVGLESALDHRLAGERGQINRSHVPHLFIDSLPGPVAVRSGPRLSMGGPSRRPPPSDARDVLTESRC